MLRSKSMTTTETFIEHLIENKSPVYIYLVNGIKLQGIITETDQHGIMLSSQNDQLVFKHAISSIIELKQ